MKKLASLSLALTLVGSTAVHSEPHVERQQLRLERKHTAKERDLYRKEKRREKRSQCF